MKPTKELGLLDKIYDDIAQEEMKLSSKEFHIDYRFNAIEKYIKHLKQQLSKERKRLKEELHYINEEGKIENDYGFVEGQIKFINKLIGEPFSKEKASGKRSSEGDEDE